MAEICCGVVSDTEATSSACEQGSRAARRRRMEIRRYKFVPGISSPTESSKNAEKRKRLESYTTSVSEDLEKAMEKGSLAKVDSRDDVTVSSLAIPSKCSSTSSEESSSSDRELPKFGMASVCGRRRDMEDAVTILPALRQDDVDQEPVSYYAVFDGHGCSHVATKCRERFHEIVREDMENNKEEVHEWKSAMERSFTRMDKEVSAWTQGAVVAAANCRCELIKPECEAVGSTAVMAIVTPEKIIVANCGDSRAVLCRNGKAVPLSSDHKPDRPDELNRIEQAGGRVIYWDCPRVLGVLAMSRSIGDNYLKPYVSCDPEVTITERTAEDECLIIASDGLWDVVSNETACGVARMCLKGKAHAPPMDSEATSSEKVVDSDKACSDASALLTKLALARRSTDNVSVVVVNLKTDT